MFLEENEEEAEKMAVKEERAKEIAKSQIKAKSKMSKAEKVGCGRMGLARTGGWARPWPPGGLSTR